MNVAAEKNVAQDNHLPSPAEKLGSRIREKQKSNGLAFKRESKMGPVRRVWIVLDEPNDRRALGAAEPRQNRGNKSQNNVGRLEP
jgi:hypothetical protein